MNLQPLVTLGQFIGAIVALIIIHELGHFVAARLLNVEVEEFGLGFPPRITTLFEAGGTQFTLNWIPLGGFVRPKGENDPSVPGGLAAASPWVRLAVLAAGPLMNLLVGAILYAIVFARIGMADPTRVEVMFITPNSPASAAGLQVGDLITQVNGQPVSSTDFLHGVIYNNLDKPIALTYIRGGVTNQVTITPRSNPPPGEGAIGIQMGNPTRPVTWYQAIPAGVEGVYMHSKALLSLPFKLANGEVSGSDARLVGFKGMYDIYQSTATNDPAPGIPASIGVLLFFTNITVSLGLLNLFPFPALDGGRILFTLPEIILRRRIPQQYENMINLVGFAILLALMLYINLQDFLSPIKVIR